MHLCPGAERRRWRGSGIPCHRHSCKLVCENTKHRKSDQVANAQETISHDAHASAQAHRVTYTVSTSSHASAARNASPPNGIGKMRTHLQYQNGISLSHGTSNRHLPQIHHVSTRNKVVCVVCYMNEVARRSHLATFCSRESFASCGKLVACRRL